MMFTDDLRLWSRLLALIYRVLLTPATLTAAALAFDRIRLTWPISYDNPSGPVSYYNVYRGSSKITPSGTQSPYDDTGLYANTAYTYYVKAVDPSGNESDTQSPSAGATTPLGPDTIPPTDPSNLQGAAVSGTWVNLTWNQSTDSGGAGLGGYEIYRQISPAAYALAGTSSVASYADHGATAATTINYKVRAYDLATPNNYSGYSGVLPVTTPDDVLPGAPGVPTITAITGSTATATWTAASDNVGVTGYRYSVNGGAWIDVGSALSANLTGLTISTSYTVAVQARDAAGNWGSSATSLPFTTLSVYTENMAFGGASFGNPPLSQMTGYISGGTGSLTPNTTINGKTIFSYYSDLELYFDGVQFSVVSMTLVLNVQGFSSNPGADWMQSIAGPGGTNQTGVSASFYYNAGAAQWSWPIAPNLAGAATLTIVHK
jgi:chitodextrinase